MSISYEEQMRRKWSVAVVGGDTLAGYEEWMGQQGVGAPTPTKRHTPPEMDGDGVFTFHDVFIEGCSLEVVPQISGNVEMTVSYGPDDGMLFSLHHLDVADLLRALLHDFHYSPERGGPADDQV